MTTTSSSSKASKRRTRRKKQNLSVGITGNTDTDVESGGRQPAPTKIIPGEAMVAQSRQAEARSEVQHRTRRTEQPARAEQHDRINSSNLNNHRRSHSTCPSNLIPTETIQIGSADGEHYIHYERQKLPPEEEKKRKAAKRRPQYDAFLCKRGSDERVTLKRHPQTGDPFVERNISKLISKTARCPGGRSMYRIDVLDRDEGNAHVASVVYAHGSELDETVRHRLGLGCNEWKDGDAMKILKSVYTKARDSEHLSKASKPTASGCYAEIGWGAGAGPQNSSFNAAPPGSSKRDGVAFPYARNPELASEIEPCLGEGLSIVNMFLDHHCPDLHMREKRNEGSHASLATSDGLCFPKPPTKGIMKRQKLMNAHQQIALRLCGWCQPGGAKGVINNPTDLDVHFPSGTRQEKESLKRLNKSRYGGSGLHVDWRDPDSRMGAMTLYVCFVEHGASNGDHETRLLEDCDLLVFQKKTGGRAICIETMKVGYVCIVFHHASRHLHGSVFPVNGVPQMLPGVEALKIVCYHTLHKLVEVASTAEDDEVLERYLRAHSEFLREKLLRRRKWYRLALCHAVSLIRIVKAALAHSNTAAQRNVYRTILHRVWRDILPVFAMEGREGQSKRRQTSFGWAHSMLGLNLICYYRRDSGVIIMRRKK